jgi:hypothetical protein
MGRYKMKCMSMTLFFKVKCMKRVSPVQTAITPIPLTEELKVIKCVPSVTRKKNILQYHIINIKKEVRGVLV